MALQYVYRRSALNVEIPLHNLRRVHDVLLSQLLPVPLRLEQHMHRNDVFHSDRGDFWHLQS